MSDIAGLKGHDLAHQLRAEAVRARDEHGNTDFYSLLLDASFEVERLTTENNMLIGALDDVRSKVKEARKVLS